MPAVSLRIDMRQPRRALLYLRDHAEPAIARALNRGRDSGRTVMVRQVARDMSLPQKDIRPKVLTDDARPGRLRARMSASLKRLPLVKFKATQFKAGVKATVRGGRKLYPSTFLATMPTGHVGVFKRRGRDRLPITELHGPSIGHVFDKHVDEARDRATEQFQKNLAHEYKRVLRQAARQ